MIAKTYSVSLQGLKPIRIEVEVNGGRGVPGLFIIGLPNRAVAEAKLRLQTSIQNVGLRLKSYKIVINLAPADLKKEAAHLDLAMAVGLLAMQGFIPPPETDVAWLGELSLDGQLKPIKNCMALCLALAALGFNTVIVPIANAPDLSQIKGLHILVAASLSEVIAAVQHHQALSTLSAETPPLSTKTTLLLDQIQGQTLAKRALTIAAAGGHHLLMIGPPGVGKTLLAQSLLGLLPTLEAEAQQELKGLYSLANQVFSGDQPPFRAPHPTITLTQLLGTGPKMTPGEISLAHHGILFLDEFLEFPRETLESLRQPLETGVIGGPLNQPTYRFPAQFSLVAATNPCPCGYSGSGIRECTCSLTAKRNYQRKLSGPLLDRLDLTVPVLPESNATAKFLSHHKITLAMWRHQETLLAQIVQARAAQYARFGSHHTNGSASFSEVWKKCQWDSASRELLDTAANQLQLSLRAVTKIIRVSQTIADLESAPQIQLNHVAESLQYRLNLAEIF